MPDFPLVWYWRPTFMRPVDRKGEPCRVLARGRRNSVLVEFRDGYRVVTSRYAVRRANLAPLRPAPVRGVA